MIMWNDKKPRTAKFGLSHVRSWDPKDSLISWLKPLRKDLATKREQWQLSSIL